MAGIFEELDCKRGKARGEALAALEETRKRILRGWLRGSCVGKEGSGRCHLEVRKGGGENKVGSVVEGSRDGKLWPPWGVWVMREEKSRSKGRSRPSGGV